MRKLIAMSLFATLFFPGMAMGGVVDTILPAIRAAEGVVDPAKRGPAGELGYYRITPAVWAQHCTEPFEICATHPEIEERVARMHLRWIYQHLVHPTIYQLAEAWNAGLSAVKNNRVPRSAQNYAQRVVNLTTQH